MLVNLARVVFLDQLVAHLVQRGFAGFSTRTGWVIRSVGTEPRSLRELAQEMGLSSPGTLKVIEPMIATGYLERLTTTDRRVRAVSVTALGWAAQAAAWEFHAQFEKSLADEVGADVAAATRQGLEALLARGSRHIPKGFEVPSS